jgi:hypothetical protein
VTGFRPGDPKEAAHWTALGITPLSFRVGKEYYSYSWAEPLTMVVGYAASAANAWKKVQRIPANTEEGQQARMQIWEGMIKGTVTTLFQNTGVQNLGTVLTGEPFVKGENFYNFLGQEAKMLIPFNGYLRAITEGVDALAGDSGKYLDANRFLSQFVQVIPGGKQLAMQQGVLVARTPLGDEKRAPVAGAPTNWLATRQSREVNDEVELELLRVGKSFDFPDQSITLIKGHEPVRMTDELFREYALDEGIKLKQAAFRVMKSSAYQAIPYTYEGIIRKTKMLEDAARPIRTQARRMVLPKVRQERAQLGAGAGVRR